MRRFGVLLGVLWALFVSVQPVAAEAPAAIEARVLEGVKYLASDDLQGRGVGTAGLPLAAEYIKKQFAASGLRVSDAESDGREFSLITGSEMTEPNTLTLASPDGETLELQLDDDFRPCSFGGSGKFSAEVAFVGYGIDAKEQEYHEFEGVDVKDKAVLIIRRNPRQGEQPGPFNAPHPGVVSRHAALRSKVSNAFTRGAKAVLFVNDLHTIEEKRREREEHLHKLAVKAVEVADEMLAADAGTDEHQAAREELADLVAQVKSLRAEAAKGNDDKLMEFGYGGNGRGKRIPTLHVTRDVADRLLEASLEKTLADVEQKIDEEFAPASAVLEGWTISGETSIKRVRTDVENVIGVLEGAGPTADETIVIGAHYDHVGLGGQGSLMPGSTDVHNGADDNASGTVALIELARRLAARETRLPRRIVFIAFTGEELGLLGSARYVKNPLFPLEQTIAMFNMDMVGRLRDDKLTVFGAGTAKRFEQQITELGEQHGFDLSLKPEGFGPSDHSSFYGKKIPVLHFFTGNHTDYHRPSDDWDKVNPKGIARVIDLLEDVILATAENAERPQYVEIKQKASMARSGSRPYFGSIPDFGSEEPGYSISGASPGSPADKAGLKGGDRIVKLGEHAIGGLDDFDLALRKFAPGDEVKVVVVRDGERLTFEVLLDKPR